MASITLEFPGMKPCAKARPRVTGNGTYMPASYRDWRSEFASLAHWQAWNHRFGGWQAPAGPLAISITYRTVSGNMRPDVDNAAGAVLDGLQDAGIIANDGQVRRLAVEVVKAKRADVGITVTIQSLAQGPQQAQQGA